MANITKEEFITRLIEQQVFDELKEGYFGGINYIRAKYEGTGINFDRVYRRIINYRIMVYGTSYIDSPGMYSYRDVAKRLKKNSYHKRGKNEKRFN